MKKEWKKLAAFSLAVCLAFTGGMVRAAASQTEDPSQLAEAVVTEDDSLSTGIRTEWTCITFGSYPQTEVVGDEFSAVDDYAIQEGDVLKDPELYQKLTEANWENNETVIDSSRYLRMSTGDTVNWSLDNEQHYRWGSKEEWHYFRYDPIRWRVAGLEDDGSAFLIADRLLDCWTASLSIKSPAPLPGRHLRSAAGSTACPPTRTQPARIIREAVSWTGLFPIQKDRRSWQRTVRTNPMPTMERTVVRIHRIMFSCFPMTRYSLPMPRRSTVSTITAARTIPPSGSSQPCTPNAVVPGGPLWRDIRATASGSCAPAATRRKA